MKKILLIPFILGLAACNSAAPIQDTIITSNKLQVIVPNDSMYQCPLYKDFPNAKTLTDVQVAKTLVNLYKNNVKCKNSIEGIRKFLNESKAEIENKPAAPRTLLPSILPGLFRE